MEASLYQFAVVFVGNFVLGIAGFGSALIIVPLLAWDWPLAVVVPLVLLIDVPAAIFAPVNVGEYSARHVNPVLAKKLKRLD